MASPIAEFPEFEPRHPTGEDAVLLESTTDLQNSRLDFLRACSSFADKPTAETGLEIGETIETYSAAMGRHLHVLYTGLDARDFASNGRDLLLIEDGQRVDFFNGLMGEAALKKMVTAAPVESLDAMLQAVLNDHAEDVNDEEAKHHLLHAIADTFNTNIADDTETLMKFLSKDKSGKLKRIGRMVGKHALDVSKTAIGTFAGVAILQLLNSTRKRW